MSYLGRQGTYTPTLYNTTNVSASTAYECMYLRQGNIVMVSGMVDIDITSPGAYELGMSLPIASDLTQSYHLVGVGQGVDGGNDALWVAADTTNNRATLTGDDQDSTNHRHYFNFTYRIL